MSVKTLLELTSFEMAMRTATEGFSISRSLAYTDFRLTVMRYQRTGQPITFKNILSQHHFIETHDGTSTLFRNIQDTAAEEEEDHDNTLFDNSDCDGGNNKMPLKRVKYV
jgi:hypothetical protein